MKLCQLELEHFRQFYGTQTLQFSTDTKKNVTLIYGSNGAGKTTILNAFTWGLYGQTTPGLAESEWLINNLAWSEAKTADTVTARVKIQFEDRGNTYFLTRTQSARKNQDGGSAMISQGALTLEVTGDRGKNEEIENPEGAIGAILPERLHRFAFFDGERDIEHLAHSDATAEIEDAIKTVLGLEVLERAIKHTKMARTKELTPELSAVGNVRDQELSEAVQRMSSELSDLQEASRRTNENLSARREELKRVDDALSTIEAAAELQSRRQEIEAAMSTAEQREADADDGIDQAIRRLGYLAFTPNLVRMVQGRAEDLHKRGEIPAPIKQKFVQELIDRQICICGTHLAEGSDEHTAVMDWFAKAGLEDVEAGWSQVSAHALSFLTRRDELYRYLHETLKEKTGYQREWTVWDQKRSEIEDEMTAVDDQQVSDMNKARKDLQESIEDDLRQIGANSQSQQDLDSNLTLAQKELEAAEQQSEQAAVARRRVKVAHEVQTICEELLASRTQQTRSDLDRRIKEVFGEMCFRPFVPSLTDDFRLTLSTTIGDREISVARSTGESQILALSFVGAVAELARLRLEEQKERDEKGEDTGLLSYQGGVFPLVLDAVFGTLDATYQEGVADALPELAPQVIVLVTAGSATEAIKERLWPKAGAVAVCALHTSAAGAQEASVETPRGNVPYRVPITEQRDYCEIQEL